MRRWFCSALLILFLASTGVLAQSGEEYLSVNLTTQLENYVLMYVSDLNEVITEPESAPTIFELTITPAGPGDETTTPHISIEAEFTTDIPGLDLQNEQIFRIHTQPFPLRNPITLTNRDIASKKSRIPAEEIEYIKGTRKDRIINQVLGSSTVPPGVYTLRIVVRSEDGLFSQPIVRSQSFEVTDRPSVQLVSPADGEGVQTPYPVFQWASSGTGSGCNYGIRIAEYNPNEHGSLQEALSDEAVLPYPDDGGYHRMSQSTSFQYPLEDAKELATGKSYVWHVRMFCPTTRGEEIVESEVFQFSLGQRAEHPSVAAVEFILGQQQFQHLFGSGGPLAGYSMKTGEIMVNGQVISLSELRRLSAQFDSGERTIISTEVIE